MHTIERNIHTYVLDSKLSKLVLTKGEDESIWYVHTFQVTHRDLALTITCNVG